LVLLGQHGICTQWHEQLSFHHSFEGNITWLVSEKGSNSTGVPIPANAQPFTNVVIAISVNSLMPDLPSS